MHNGVGPMPKTKDLLADQGATATNWFIHTVRTCARATLSLRGRAALARDAAVDAAG